MVKFFLNPNSNFGENSFTCFVIEIGLLQSLPGFLLFRIKEEKIEEKKR